MKRLCISAISFLNTAPLMWDFEHGKHDREFEIAYTVPSACAEALRKSTADIGIIPAISYQNIPDLQVIPEIAIAADGPVRSILLVSKVPREEITTVAVDTSSRTSVALLQILFERYWQPSMETRHASSLPQFITNMRHV
jgi:chorismate dehydratase